MAPALLDPVVMVGAVFRGLCAGLLPAMLTREPAGCSSVCLCMKAQALGM